MPHLLLRSLAATALLWAVAACSSPNPGSAATGTFPADAYTSIASTSGALLLAVRTSPQPPSVGTNEVELTITRASDGTPVDGLIIAVEPWMPAMQHGTSVTPVVAQQGGGVYLVTNVYLYMQGSWTLRTTVSGPVSDDAAPQLEIQ